MEVDQPRTSENRDGESYVGESIAKEFDGGNVYRGTVTRYYVPSNTGGSASASGSGSGGGLWHVVYEDDDEEDLNADELQAAMRLAAAAAGDGAASGANANAGSSSTASANSSSSSSSRTSNAFADEVERIVQSAEGRELSASAADGGVGGGGGDGGSGPPVGSPPARITGAGAPGGPLTAAEIGRLSVLCASLEQQQQQTAAVANAAASSAANHPLRRTDAEAAHSVLPGAAASDDGEYGAAASDACPPLSGWAGVDGDVLAQLIPMLERHVRSASNVDLVGEARAVAEHGQAGGGGGGGGRKKKKAKAAGAGGSSGGSSGEDDEDGGNDSNNNKAATVGEWISSSGNHTPHGIAYPGSGHHRLEIIKRGLEAASVLLAVVTSRGIDQRAVSEDAIESCVSFLRQHLIRNVVPAIGQTGHLGGAASPTSVASGTADADHITPRKGKQAAAATTSSKKARKGSQGGRAGQLANDLKKVYKPICTTVGLLSVLMERVELLVRTVQLEDQQLMSICSAVLSTMALEPAQTPQGNAALAHVVQIASISLVTGIFRRYPRHRTIIVEDLFPLMLKMPTSRKTMRTYATKNVSKLRTMELLDAAGIGGGASGTSAAALALKSPVPSRRRSSSGGRASSGGGGFGGEQGHIQMMSALFLHLVQACVAMPVAVAPRLGDEEEEEEDGNGAAEAAKDSWDVPQLTSGTAGCEAIVNMFVSGFAKRCSRRGEEGGASEFRPVLTNLVEDMLQVRFDPEFPAADMLLHAFCKKMTQDLLRCSSIGADRSTRLSAESTYLTTAFSVLSMISSSVQANLRCHKESPLVLPQATDIDEEGEELVVEKTDVKCFCGRINLTDVFMIDCDRCHGWFHGSCIGITRENAPSAWTCDDCTLQLMVIEESNDFANRSNRRKRSSSEITGAGNDTGASTGIGDVYVMRQLLLNFLASTKSPLNKAAREMHLARWVDECEQARGSNDRNTVIDAEVKEVTYLDLWHLPNQDSSDNGLVAKKKYLTDEGNGKLMESLAAINGDLSTSFPRLLGVILGLMGDVNSTALRKLAVKAISTIMLVDPKLMHQKMVSAAVAQRFQDEAISVREASVSLVGSFVLQSPNSAVGFYPLLLDKLHDEGVSVRKRAVKIFRDLMLTAPSFSGRAAACSVMLQRAADPKEDDGVRDLIHETFQALWFDTAKVELSAEEEGDGSTKPTRRRNKKAMSASEQRLATASSQMVEVVGCSNGKSDTLAKLVKELLFGFGEGQNKGGAAARKKRHEAAQAHCTKIVSALIELILSFEEERVELDKETAGKKLVALLATLEVFAESSPTLLIEHIDTILPYLKGENGVSRDNEAAIAASVCKTISRCSPLLSAVDAERLSGVIVEDLSKVINRLGPNAMSAAIEALSRLAAHPDAGTMPETKLLALATTFYSFLHRACDTDIAKLKASNRGMVHRALSALGSICRFHEFSEDVSENVDLSAESSSVLDPSDIELDWTTIVPAAFSMLALYLKKDHAPTRCQALKGLNGIFVAQPRLMLAVEQTGLIADVMDDSSGADLQLAALACWRELLVCEEKRIESGEAKEKMEARQDITVSKRISGDQDEDASLVGGVMAQHSKRFYQMLMSPNVRIRAGCLDLVGDLLRQGLINPIQTIPFLLALQGDVGAPDIRARALKLLVVEGEKRPDSLRQRVKVGCKEAFNFQRKAYPDKPITAVTEKKIAGSNKIECIFDKVFVESIRSSKANRHGLFNSLLSLFEVETDIDSKDKKSIGRARKLLHLQAFAAQVLATLPYTDLSDALYIVYHINARLSDAEMFAEKMADFLRPHGLAPSDMYDILDDDEDAIEEAVRAKNPSKELEVMSSGDFDADIFADLCSSASALVLLMKLKSHLVNVFSLKAERILAYNPSEKNRPHDKGHSSTATSVFSIEKYVAGGSKIEECIERYAIWKQVTRASHREEVELSKAKNNSARKRRRSGSTSSADDGESEDSSGEQSDEAMEE